MLNIEIKKLHPDAVIPVKASDGAAGIDLVNITGPKLVHPHETILVPTGLSIWIKDRGHAAIIIPRSSLGVRGLVLANGVGLIDSDYQGELKVALWNRTSSHIELAQKERMAQLVILPVSYYWLTEVTEFSNVTKRGEGGFGSTGKT